MELLNDYNDQTFHAQMKNSFNNSKYPPAINEHEIQNLYKGVKEINNQL